MQDCQKSGERQHNPEDHAPLQSSELPPNPSQVMDGQVDQSESSSPQIETDQTSELAPGKKDSIDANSVTDEATAHDSLDFEPYVNALAEFLISPKTQPPLTLAIEGEWGSGKSSFMLQLQDRLNTKRAPKHTIVCFNPWRYEKQEELWAAFTLKLTLAGSVGNCGAISSSTTVQINEATTVGTVWPLAPFITSPTAIGADSSQANQLAAAATLVEELVNPATGTIPGPALSTGTAAPTIEQTMLGAMISSCVVSPGGSAGAVQPAAICSQQLPTIRTRCRPPPSRRPPLLPNIRTITWLLSTT